MARLIVICGLQGSGKTTLANILTKKLKIFCLSKDLLKASLYKTMGMSTLEDSKKLGYPSVKGILDLAEENLSKGIDVILEAPFNFPDEGEIFKEWKKKYDINIFSIILKVSEEERKKRFGQRVERQGLHDEERRADYAAMRCAYDHMPEKKIFIETNRPPEKLIEQIFDEINNC